MARKARAVKAAKAQRTPKVAGWELYFPIPKGRSFDVALVRPPLPVRGRGTVVKRTATALQLRLEIPGGFLIPRMAAEVDLTFTAEGGGNSGHVEVQAGARREAFSDEDVTIVSQPLKRSREIVPSLAPRGRSARALLRATREGECFLSAQGFELRLTATAS